MLGLGLRLDMCSKLAESLGCTGLQPGMHRAAAWDAQGCYTTVTLLLHYHYTTVTLLLHYCYTTVTLPAAALGLIACSTCLGLRGGGEGAWARREPLPRACARQQERMTYFNKRREARASYLMRNVALCGAARHQNQQAFRNVWLDNEVIKKNMWRAEADIPGSWGTHALEAGDSPLMDRWRRGETAAAGLTMDMTEEAYRNLPRSNKVERRAAKAIDNLKMGCAQGRGAWAGNR